MNFFTEMKLLTSDISNSQHLKNAEGTIQLRAEIDQLAQSFEYVEKILAAAVNKSRDGLASQPLIGTLVAINRNAKATLQAVKASYIPSEDGGNTNRRTTPSPHDSLEQRVAIDNLKMKALLRTLNFNMATHLGLPRNDVDEHRKSVNTQSYIKVEMQRYNRRKENEVEHPLLHKWTKLHEESYLGHISENSLELEWSLSQRLHAVAQHLNAASGRVCDESTRWLHCMMCFHHMQAAKNSAEYRLICDSSNIELEELGLTIENYIGELERELLKVLDNLPSRILDACEIVQHSSSGFTRFIGRDQDPARNSQFTPSISTEDGEIMKVSLNSFPEELLLRRGPHGSIKIEPRHNKDRLNTGNLPEKDLRSYRWKPLYVNEQRDSKCWDVIVDTPPLNTLAVKLSFQRSDKAYEFQQIVTGYRVSGDYGPDVVIRTHRRRFGSSSGKEDIMSGRLQFWERKLHEQVETNPMSQSGDSISTASNMSTTTRNVASRFKSAQVFPINKTETAIRVKEPHPPFIALLVESSNDSNVKKGDIFAVGVDPKVQINKSKCGCGCLNKDRPCTWCILYYTKRVRLTLQHGVEPGFESRYTWIVISFKYYTDREKFEKKLDTLRKLHNMRLEDTVEDINMVLRGM